MKKNKTILIVEDDEEINFAYKEILSSDYKLIIVNNTKDALKKLEKNKVNLMILDIVLPNESGDIFFKRIKQDKKYKNLKTIVITVLGDVSDYFKSIDEKNTICIPKPFTKRNLLLSIEEMLNKKE